MPSRPGLSRLAARAPHRAATLLLYVLAIAGCTHSSPALGTTSSSPPALDAIRTNDLRSDLFTLASDAMRGREAGTLDELRAAAWVAARARAAGLEPAGDDSTYFQFWPMRRTRVADADVEVDGHRLALWRDVFVAAPVDTVVDAPLIYAGEARDADLAGLDVRGKAVAVLVSAPTNPPPRWISLWAWRYTSQAMRQRANALRQRGAVAVVFIADSIAERQLPYGGASMERGRYNIDSTGTDRVRRTMPTFLVRARLLDAVRRGGRFTARVRVESYVYPSVNVIARVRGTDPARRGEYVLFSGHHDHDGVRFPVDGDSIWNGADDNASTSVALLAIGRAFVRHPAPRSALFVWHGAEERGLLGSRWHVWHPVVPRDSIVAVLNGDMLGRNSPDTAALLGVIPPHRNSSALVAMALGANEQVSHFVIDSSWDQASHPERWYFRSDQLPYARAGIPALFFTTLLHADYHSPRDEASRIDYAKLRRVTQWMYATGWAAATADQRPALDARTPES